MPPFCCPVHPLLTLRQTSGGWIYLYCPEESCTFSCPAENFQLIERLSLEQVPCKVRTNWESMRCFCQKRVRLRLRHTTKNPHCLFLSCPKKDCDFFQWITTPWSLKITDHLLRILPVRQEEEEESCAPKLVMDTPESVKALQNCQAFGKYGGGISF